MACSFSHWCCISTEIHTINKQCLFDLGCPCYKTVQDDAPLPSTRYAHMSDTLQPERDMKLFDQWCRAMQKETDDLQQRVMNELQRRLQEEERIMQECKARAQQQKQK